MFLTRISVGHPVFATMVMLLLTILGAVSYGRLPIEREPDVDFPVVAVSVPYAGASPEAVEEDILRPIEDAVSTIGGIDDIEATAIQGRGSVIMFFDLGVDSADAAQEVRDRLAGVQAAFPDGAGDVTVRRFDPSSRPVMSIAVSSPTMAVGDLTALAEDVVARRLLTIQGVGSATVVGGAERRVDVLLDPDRMNAFGVGVAEVTAAIAAENRDQPAGEVRSEGRVQAVTVEGRIEEAEDFLQVVVADGEGLPVTLGDVATVRAAEAEEESLALLDGRRSLSVDVVQQQGANTVAVAEGVRAAVRAIEAEGLPPGAALRIVQDDAVDIERSFESVQTMLIEGAVLATVIVFLFLNSWRSTIITGLTLPISVIGTMTALWALGFTLNVMTLLALSLAIGILIDDAIVVRENIMRHLAMGKSHRRAALEGTNEIGLAVLATTLSIVAVFLPVAFMEGIIGRFFLQFGVTVSIAVLLSLFVAFTLDPMLSSVWYDPAADPRAPKGPVWRLLASFDRGFEAVGRGYRAVLRACLRHRPLTLLVAAGAFAGSFALVPLVGVEFAPSVDDGEVRVRIETPVGSSLEYTAGKARQVEEIVRAFPEVAQTYTTVASGGFNTSANQASITATLVPESERDRSPQDLTTPIREALEVVPGVEATIGASRGFGGGSPISITLRGDSSAVLTPLADDLVAALGRVPGVVDAATSLADTQPTLAVRLDPDAANDLGVSLATVGDTLSALIGGEAVGEWTSPEGRSYELVVRLPPELRDDVASLGSLPVRAEGGALVRLDQVAAIEPSVGASEITRSNLARNVTVTADIQGRTLGEVQAGVDAAIASLDLPVGYAASQGGESEQLAESGASALTALVLAVIFIYLVLASQFGSFLQPFAIMLSLPLSLAGVLLGLIVGGTTLNIYSAIGFIMLMGLVVKNAILLVDNANQRVREGLHLFDALLEAGETRFRPIVMTTLAMIFGMLPLALNLHGGSAENAPMAHAVIGGLVSSTLLTLVVVPVALTYADALGRLAGRWFRAPPEHDEAAPVRPAVLRPAAE